jgi:hypothetical protein
MPELVLSNGFTIQPEHVRHAEYYPSGSLRSDGFISGVPIHHKQDFLFIRLSAGIAHVRGCGAERDATALEAAGVRVYRRPIPRALRPS